MSVLTVSETAKAVEPKPAATRIRQVIVGLGTLALVSSILIWSSQDLLKYLTFLALALVIHAASILSPSAALQISASLVVVLFSTAQFTLSETMFLAALATLLPGIWRQVRIGTQPNLAMHTALSALAAGAAALTYDAPTPAEVGHPFIRLTAATLVLFFIETTPRIWLEALEGERSVLKLWVSEVAWAVPYYFCATLLAFIMTTVSDLLGWATVVASGPAVYLIYRSYRLYLHRLEDQKKHAEEMAALHFRTIEALALAIEAKDDTTHDHLQRVQIYARELAKELGLSPQEKEALLAASVLHDIGKLAVPEHIISKPGRLTPEEFEKMKVHPVVGAEILERVRFPYPVAPIVRTHHEKWDGTGYPAGLKGEEIPIGARILAAVDCLDALASDRQYRRALPLDQAMDVVRGESGKAFDPRVVDVLSRRYVELERMAQGAPSHKKEKLSKDVKVELGEAPAAGFESAGPTQSADSKEPPVDFLNSIASARQEVQTLFEISQDLGTSIRLDETLSLLSVRLRRIIPHDSLVIWLREGDTLNPGHVSGEDYRLLSSLRIPVGQGLSGWVAENGKPIVNGNPTVESGYLNDPKITSTLRSAVAVPLEGHGRNVGVLALYHSQRDAFSRDHLRILNAVSSKIGISIENALRFQQAEANATTDSLTSLPNARSLFLQLDAELSRAKRGDQPLTVVTLDLDGFKTIKERFGQIEGNRILTQMAAGLRSSCREYDFVARMGGDEFVILMPGMKPHDAASRIEQLRSIVLSAGAGLFPDRPLTASIGVSNYPHDGTDAEQLLAEADRRMYREKQDHKEAWSASTTPPRVPDPSRSSSYKALDLFASSSL